MKSIGRGDTGHPLPWHTHTPRPRWPSSSFPGDVQGRTRACARAEQTSQDQAVLKATGARPSVLEFAEPQLMCFPVTISRKRLLTRPGAGNHSGLGLPGLASKGLGSGPSSRCGPEAIR